HHAKIAGTIGDLYTTLYDDVMGVGLGKTPTATRSLHEILVGSVSSPSAFLRFDRLPAPASGASSALVSGRAAGELRPEARRRCLGGRIPLSIFIALGLT